MKDIEWQIDSDKKLYLIDADATKAAREAAEAKAKEDGMTEEEIKTAGDAAEVVYAGLNPGRTWIGWASQNNGGELEIIPNEPKEEAAEGEGADGEGADAAEDSGDSAEGAEGTE